MIKFKDLALLNGSWLPNKIIFFKIKQNAPMFNNATCTDVLNMYGNFPVAYFVDDMVVLEEPEELPKVADSSTVPPAGGLDV